jgi:prophage antirepressor-like protein
MSKHTQNLSTIDMRTLANPFQFNNLDIRTATDPNDEVWFCAKDVFEALDITWKGASGSLKNTPEKWQGVWQLQTPGGSQEAVFISEPAVYQTAFTSRKPEAIKFTEWVCEEVLPEIRRNGFFGTVSLSEQVQISKQIDSLSEKIVGTKNAYRRKLLHDQLRRLCNMVNQPMPPLAWINKDFDQIELFEE